MKERDVAVAKPKGVKVSDDMRFFLGMKVWSGLYDTDEILEIAMDAGWERDAVRGGCFYHGQDLERVVLGYDLWLAYGATTDSDDDSVTIAQEIVEVLKAHGFVPDWNGSVDGRISIPINWQRRFGPIADTSPPDKHMQKV